MISSEIYTQNIIALQPRLYAYVLTVLTDPEAADDVLQEINLVLCRKASEFEPGSCFEAWAFRIARLQCLAYWKTRSRDRLVIDEAAIAQIADRAESQLTAGDDRVRALRKCIEQLTVRNRELLQRRYEVGRSVKQLSALIGRSEASLSQTLYRIRTTLLDCVRARLAAK